jgi:hypothetical protein
MNIYLSVDLAPTKRIKRCTQRPNIVFFHLFIDVLCPTDIAYYFFFLNAFETIKELSKTDICRSI